METLDRVVRVVESERERDWAAAIGSSVALGHVARF